MAALSELRHPRRQAAPLHLLTASTAAGEQPRPDDSSHICAVSLVSSSATMAVNSPGVPLSGECCLCWTMYIPPGACSLPGPTKQGWLLSCIQQQSNRMLCAMLSNALFVIHRREAADLRAQQQGEAARSIVTAAREATATLQRLGKQQAAAAAERAEAKAKQDAIDEVRSHQNESRWQLMPRRLAVVAIAGCSDRLATHVRLFVHDRRRANSKRKRRSSGCPQSATLCTSRVWAALPGCALQLCPLLETLYSTHAAGA